MKLWQAYKKLVETNTLPDETPEIRGLSYWRDKLFANILLYMLPVSVVAYLPGVVMSVISGIPLLAVYDTLAIVGLVVIIFVPSISLFFRKIFLIICLYLLSIILLVYLGSFGPGLLYLLALSIFATLIFPISISRWTVVVNLLICVLFAIVIHFKFLQSPITNVYTLGAWIAVSSNVVFLSAVIVVAINQLFNGLQTTIIKESCLKKQLGRESQKLAKMLENMETKNQELEQFAYIASHDMQEPLRTITSVIEVFERQYEGKLDQDALTYLDFLSQSSHRMQALITGLLEYSRIGKEKAPEFVNSKMVFDEVINDLNASIKETKAVVSAHNLPSLNAYPLELKLLLQNLISNAIKFRKPNQLPEVTVRAEEREDYFIFSVKDNGIGIDERYRNKIFIIFQRLHPKSKYEGTGIGLAHCKKIAELHGGKIWVDSIPNQGSTFYFTIAKELTYEG